MNVVPINPDFVPLLKGVRPFLGGKGQNLTDMALNFLNLIMSQQGQETVEVFSRTFGPKSQGLNDASPIQYAFILFLILILLILSSTYLMGNVNSGECTPPADGAGPEDVIGEV